MGTQIFAVEWISASAASGFPYRAGGRNDPSRLERLFYGYRTVSPRSTSQ
jgi:hypothetical protein